jgi:hypothetical protein
MMLQRGGGASDAGSPRVSSEVATCVSNALVKSRAGTDQPIALLHRLTGVAPTGEQPWTAS